MKAEFWHQRWEQKKIGFHMDQPNPLLVEHFDALGLSPGQRVFVPLCGKTLDIGWLLGQGYQVVGAELSEIAIKELFAELGLTPKIEQLDGHRHYQAAGLDVFVGDIFELSETLISPIDAVYDRAALVAFPQTMRMDYSQQLQRITQNAPQLLISYDYDQNTLEGPPFAVSPLEVQAHYGARFELKLLYSGPVEKSKRADLVAEEQVWHLSPKADA